MKVRSMQGWFLAALALSGLAAPALIGAAPDPVRRTIGSYFILGLREVGLKNLDLRSDLGTCGSPTDAFLNIGVDCEGDAFVPHCGYLRMETAHVFSPGGKSQVVADVIRVPKPGGQTPFAPVTTLDQVFRNNTGEPLPPAVIVNNPPEQLVSLPILPGTCDAFCEPDTDAVRTACNFPDPYPTCNQTANFTVHAGQDCLPYDSNIGNGFCDLPPGTFGFVKMASSGAVLNMQAGTYVFCTFKAGSGSIVNGNGAEMQIVAGRLGIGNLSTIGQGCGDLTILSNSSKSISFGKNSTVKANLCAPTAHVRLGHNNSLTGQFIGLRRLRAGYLAL